MSMNEDMLAKEFTWIRENLWCKTHKYPTVDIACSECRSSLPKIDTKIQELANEDIEPAEVRISRLLQDVRYITVGENIIISSYVVLGEDGKLYKAKTGFNRNLIFQTPQSLKEGDVVFIDDIPDGNKVIRLETKVGQISTVVTLNEQIGDFKRFLETKKEEEPKPKPDPISRPVYYNKLSLYICDSNDKPILDLMIDNDEAGRFISDAINNA